MHFFLGALRVNSIIASDNLCKQFVSRSGMPVWHYDPCNNFFEKVGSVKIQQTTKKHEKLHRRQRVNNLLYNICFSMLQIIWTQIRLLTFGAVWSGFIVLASIPKNSVKRSRHKNQTSFSGQKILAWYILVKYLAASNTFCHPPLMNNLFKQFY